MDVEAARQQLADEIRKQIPVGIPFDPARARRLADRLIDLVLVTAKDAGESEQAQLKAGLEAEAKKSAIPLIVGGVIGGFAAVMGIVYYRRRRKRAAPLNPATSPFSRKL